MDLDRLRTFIRVAETGSLSAASDVLRIAQPALSRQIRLLEDEVGQRLFVRSRQGMEPTAAGTRSFRWTAADFGVEASGREALLVDGPAASADVIRQILAGKQGPPRDIVIVNAAASLWTVGRDPSPDRMLGPDGRIAAAPEGVVR